MANSIDPQMFIIDSKHLDIEWGKQASNAFECSRIASQARLILEDFTRQYDVARAEAYSLIRQDPSQFGMTTKPTEAAIDAVLTCMPQLRDLSEKISAARYQFNLAQAAVNAIENKKKALEGLSSLLAMNYYSAK